MSQSGGLTLDMIDEAVLRSGAFVLSDLYLPKLVSLQELKQLNAMQEALEWHRKYINSP